VRLTTYHHIVPMSRNLGALTLLDPSGHAWPVMGVLYLYLCCCCWRRPRSRRGWKPLRWGTEENMLEITVSKYSSAYSNIILAFLRSIMRELLTQNIPLSIAEDSTKVSINLRVLQLQISTVNTVNHSAQFVHKLYVYV
jgi:hypothetical protein